MSKSNFINRVSECKYSSDRTKAIVRCFVKREYLLGQEVVCTRIEL